MTPPNPNQFDPPTPDRLAQHLAEHPAVSRRSMHGLTLPVVVAGAVLLGMVMLLVPALGMLIVLVPLGAVVWLAARVQKARALQQQVTRAWELAMLRDYRVALRRAWTLLPNVTAHPQLHARCVAVIAQVLDELACYDSAMVAMDHLLDRLPERHPMAIQVKLQRVNAALCADHLADADDALRKLRGTVEPLPDGTLTAGYRLARLVQDVRTGHFADAAQHAEDTARDLRPLGVHAGYGYGLLAYCQHQLALRNDDADVAAQQHGDAQRYWDQATLLIPPAALAQRYRELSGMDPATPTPGHETGTPQP